MEGVCDGGREEWRECVMEVGRNGGREGGEGVCDGGREEEGGRRGSV